MSRSYRTDPKWRIAARNAKRDADGSVLLPRIVQRKPRVGDIHPVSKWTLAKMLSRLPAELYYGLRLIELCPRQGLPGEPFGEYSLPAKTIRLYSLPPVLRFKHISNPQRRLLVVSKAKIERDRDGLLVSWEDPHSMGFWFYHEVFLHELGHHHRFHYRGKRGRPARVADEEALADNYRYLATLGRLSPKNYARPVLSATAELR